MKHLSAGFFAGFVASLVLSGFMVAKMMLGVIPALNVIKMLAAMLALPLFWGWVAHFAIGTIAWGGLFALLNDEIPSNTEMGKGIVFATFAWFAMMLFFMPMAGVGLFGAKLGIMAPVITLILHWIFGAVMGAVYWSLTQTEATA